MRDGWERCIVAATGPSLTEAVADTARLRQSEGWRLIAVNDAYKILPSADVLYACDRRWWEIHQPVFAGEKWSSHSSSALVDDNKLQWGKSEGYGIKLMRADTGDGFCFAQDMIYYGDNSGFQAVNLALTFGAKRVKMIGFDMRKVDARSHFFGEHCAELRVDTNYTAFIDRFDVAARLLPPDVLIENCTVGSALRSFATGEL